MLNKGRRVQYDNNILIKEGVNMEWYTILLIVVGVINFMVMMGLFGKHEKLDEIQEALLDHKKQIKQLRMELELSDQIRGTNEGTFKEQIDDLTLRIDNYSSYIAGIEKALSDRIEELDKYYKVNLKINLDLKEGE
jgi:hypothetical protein